MQVPPKAAFARSCSTGLTGEGEPSGWKASPSQPQLCCPRGAGRQKSLHAELLVLRTAPLLLNTHLLFFGWYPQKEMFFSWKKWLQLFT